MNIEIKKSIKPVNYFDAINALESRLKDLYENNEQELIWTLEHNEVFTAGTSYKENEVIDKSIKILETNRGGKITYHGPGQLICYFVLDLRKKKDIKKFISIIEKTIIQTLKVYKIEAFSDRKNTFEKEVIEFNKKTQKKRQALAKAEKDSVRTIEDEVEKIVKEIIDTEKITAVFRNSAVILSDKSIDITPKVVTELNKRLGSVTVKVTP